MRAVLLIPLVLVIASPIGARAETVVYELSARVDRIWDTGGNDPEQLVGFVAEGDEFTARFSFDDSVAPLPPPPPPGAGAQIYLQDPARFGIDLSFGPEGALRTPDTTLWYLIGVTDNFGGGGALGAHLFRANLALEPGPVGWPQVFRLSVAIDLWDTTGSTFSSSEIPDALLLSDFDRAEVVVQGIGPAWRFDSRIVSLTEVPAPEPVPMPPMALGILGLGLAYLTSRAGRLGW